MRAAARQFVLDSEFNRGFAQERWNASRASRLVDRRMVLGEVEKEKFRSMMRKVEGCYGVADPDLCDFVESFSHPGASASTEGAFGLGPAAAAGIPV